ncbi:hypothetical protein RND81_01G085300 [Saponaria officinalis]|uniref:Retrotransposon Copia-like N-terminal domain-containing protein n=1 Tax=Saponaria officinalis TaxID=3572 RepID=A0AAW1N6E2_SAPOF
MDSAENTHTLKITTILIGSENYPLWRRQMELTLSAKRRLGYVTGKVAKPKEDEEKIETWTVANNQVITWILQNMAEYLEAVATQAEERKLFQFLNGLDKSYGILRSNILLMDPLPSVEHTVSLMLQEEMQANNVSGARPPENSALMGRGETERERCIHCGRDNYRSDLCLEVKGYPVGHPKHGKMNYKPGIKTTGTGGSGYKQQRTYPFSGRQPNFKRNAANAKTNQGDLSTAIGAATQQLENLLRMVLGSGNVSKAGGESEEELE